MIQGDLCLSQEHQKCGGPLQGPFSDAMTHAGQLAMLRRLAGHPVPPENFIAADIDAARLGPEQAAPVSPDDI